jgi:hypothetical protein
MTKALILALITAFSGLGQQHPSSPDPILDQERSIAAQVESHVHLKGLDVRAKRPEIRVETKPGLSSYHSSDRVIRVPRWEELPRPLQVRFNLWASYTADEPSGQQFFSEVFYRYFFVREMGRWLESAVLTDRKAEKDRNAHRWQSELTANRISVAWWREQEPDYLARLLKNFAAVQQKLHNPVPPGQDMRSYFEHNAGELSKNPDAYTWFQLEFALLAEGERPIMSFQQAIDRLAQPDQAK